ncbi:hypothetical protein [Rhodobacteraceae bacterium DSL-40]|uniref:hypothetical protein n=1 Tax=Amaricoccus sp. B4 TaxID=3368557 RepID=UPI000DABEB48
MDLLRYMRISPQVALLLRRRMRARLLQLEREAAASERTLVVSAKNISLHTVLFWQRRDPPPRTHGLLRPQRGWAQEQPIQIVIGLRSQARWPASRYAESGKDNPRFNKPISTRG